MSLSRTADPGQPARPISVFPLGPRLIRRSGYGAMHLAGARLRAGPGAQGDRARRDPANGVQLAARYQGTQHHGSTASGANSGKTAATLGLFSYNPVTEPT